MKLLILIIVIIITLLLNITKLSKILIFRVLRFNNNKIYNSDNNNYNKLLN